MKHFALHSDQSYLLLVWQALLYFQRALKLDTHFLSAWTLMGHEYVEIQNCAAAIGETFTARSDPGFIENYGIFGSLILIVVKCCYLYTCYLQMHTAGLSISIQRISELGMAWVRLMKCFRCLHLLCTTLEGS